MDPPPPPSSADLPRHFASALRAVPDADPAAALRTSGALAWPLPRRLGGAGIGTEPEAAEATCALLREAGRHSLSVGRLYEGHINAIRLILRHGTAEQAARLAAEAPDHLFAIWAAEDPANPLRLQDGLLQGQKTFASGAGSVTRALLTAQAGGEQLALAALAPGDGRIVARVALHGMAGAGTARVDLTGLPAEPVGRPGDYMAQPEISLGAWRTLAVISGGITALVEALRTELLRTHRHGAPAQRARLGTALAWDETARLWVRHAALRAEQQPGEDAAAYVKLAREAVGWAVPAVIALAQRSAGLSALLAGHRIEALCRDLATYARQPALDETLDEAAAHFLAAPPMESQ